MTKKYIAFTDNVLPVNGYVSTDEGKVAKVVNDSGNYKLEVVDAGPSSTTWSDVTDKPFSSIGTGLTVTNSVLSADTQLHFEIVDELPTASATYAQTIALVLKSQTETGNIYDEYACVNTSATSTPNWAWEKIGSTAFELTITQNTSGITINSTVLQSATSAQKGLLTAADWATFNGKQDVLTFDNAPTEDSANPVKSGGVFSALEDKVDKVANSSLVPDSKVTAYDTHIADTTIHVTASDKSNWNGKQSQIPAGTSGNVVTYSGTAGTVSSVAVDSTVTALSTNLVTSGAVSTAIAGKVDEDSISTVTFTVGCDSTGPYVDF